MATYITAFLVFGTVIFVMAVGVMVSGRRIRGSCGGLSTWKDELGQPMCVACADCPKKKLECELAEREDQNLAGATLGGEE